MKRSIFFDNKVVIVGLVFILFSILGYVLFFSNAIQTHQEAGLALDFTEGNRIDIKEFLGKENYHHYDSPKRMDTLETIKYLSAMESNCRYFYRSSIFLAELHLKHFRRGEALNELINLRIFIQKNCNWDDFREVDFLIIRALLLSWNPSTFEKERALSLARYHLEEAQKRPEDSLYYKQALNTIFQTYQLINYDSALNYLRKIELATSEDKTFLRRARLERRYKNHDNELYFMRKALKANRESLPNDELGVAYRNLGQCDSAYFILNGILQRNLKIMEEGGPSFIMIPMINIGKWHVVCGDSIKGKEYLERAMEMALDRKSSYHVDEIAEFYKEHFINRNDLMKYTLYLDSHYKQEHVQEALFKNLLFSHNITETKSNQQESYIRYLLFLLSLLVLGIFFLYWRSKGDKKKSVGDRFKAMKRENDMAKLKLAYNTKNEFIGNSLKIIFSKLKKIDSSDRLISKNVEELKKLVISLSGEVEKLDEFNNIIEYWDPDFFAKLLDINPKLTQLDLKHCIFIVMNMSNVEVAKILNIAPDSVNMHRYRLKQKLAISEDQSIHSFLSKLIRNA